MHIAQRWMIFHLWFLFFFHLFVFSLVPRPCIVYKKHYKIVYCTCHYAIAKCHIFMYMMWLMTCLYTLTLCQSVTYDDDELKVSGLCIQVTSITAMDEDFGVMCVNVER